MYNTKHDVAKCTMSTCLDMIDKVYTSKKKYTIKPSTFSLESPNPTPYPNP
eukprot:m.167678 g.167678  ORF g.167678 m.167678 type:complete len:51 (-) comp12857_c0_seq1:1997-2149(-)